MITGRFVAALLVLNKVPLLNFVIHLHAASGKMDALADSPFYLSLVKELLQHVVAWLHKKQRFINC